MDSKLEGLHASHVMIVPWLMTYLWRKQLVKEDDQPITIPVGLSFWNVHHFEPPSIACLLTFLCAGSVR